MATSVAPEIGQGGDELDKALAEIRSKGARAPSSDPMDQALAEIRSSSRQQGDIVFSPSPQDTATPKRKLGPVTPLAPMPAQPDVTETRKTIGGLGTHRPGQSGHLGQDVAESAMEMITHPVRTAAAIAETPARAGYALGKYVRGEGSGREAAIGAIQTAALGLAGPAEDLAEPLIGKLVGEAAAPAVTGAAVGAATGATFTPDRPVLGAILGGAAGGIGSLSKVPKVARDRARFEELAKQHPDWLGENAPAAPLKQLGDGKPVRTATATVTESPPDLSHEGPDYAVGEPNAAPEPVAAPPVASSIIEKKGVFGGGLEQHGRDFAAGKIPPPTAGEVPAAAEPVAPSAFDQRIEESRAKGWPDPTPEAERELGDGAWEISHEETARELMNDVRSYRWANEVLKSGIDPKTEKPWKDTQAAKSRHLQTQDDVNQAKRNYSAMLGQYEATFGPDGLKTFLEKTGLPEDITGDFELSRMQEVLKEPVALAPFVDEAEGPTSPINPKGEEPPRVSNAELVGKSEPVGKIEEKSAAEKHDYASTQLNLPGKAAVGIKRLAASIPDEDLAADGREDNPHITVKYGLHGNPSAKLTKLLAGEPPVTVTLGKTSFFPNSESNSGDVLKADVDSPDLHRLNKLIADALPHTDTHPGYKPHATIAYLKPGLGKKYAGDNSLAGEEIVLDHITFSGKDGKTIDIPLKGTTATHAERRAATRPEPADLTAADRASRRASLESEQARTSAYAHAEMNPARRAMYTARHERITKEIAAIDALEMARHLKEVRAAAKEAPKPVVKPAAGKLGKQAKEPIYESARGPTGRLRDNLSTVKTDGLVHEMFKLLGAEDQRDQQAAIYRNVEADVSGTQYGKHIQVATRHGAGPSEQAKALHRIELAKGAAKRIEDVLNARGLKGDDITWRYLELTEIARDRAVEQEGLDSGTGDASFDVSGYTEGDAGKPAKGTVEAGKAGEANAPAKGASRGVATADGRRQAGGTPEPEKLAKQADQVARQRADLYEQLHKAPDIQARHNVIERIRALERKPATIALKGAISSEEMAQRAKAGETREAVTAITGEEPTKLSTDRRQSEMFGEEVVEPEAPPEPDLFSMMKTGENTAGSRFDKSLFKKLGSNLYKGDIPSVIVKEAIQNSFDSTRPLGADGRIHVDINAETRTITIQDNGHGMTPEVAANEFMDVGGSSKLEGSAGGFGLAKVGLLASAEHFRMRTVVKTTKKGLLGGDRYVATTIEGSADDWIDGKLKYKTEQLGHDTPESTGTTLSITIEKNQAAEFNNARFQLTKLMAYSRGGATITGDFTPRYEDTADYYADPGNVKAKVRPKTPIKPPPYALAPDYNDEAAIRVSVPGADIVATPSRKLAGSGLGSQTSIAVLNNGLFQFTTGEVLGAGAPESLSVNIVPTAHVDAPNYPFTTSREDLKGPVIQGLSEIYKKISLSAGKNEINALIKALNGGFPLSSEGHLGYRVRLFDTTGATPDHLLERLAGAPYVRALAEAIGESLHDLSGMIGQRYNYSDYAYGGLSTSPGYLGVNIWTSLIADKAKELGVEFNVKEQNNLILYNPWLTFKETAQAIFTKGYDEERDGPMGPLLVQRLAEQTFGTLVHELAHQLARGHEENFAGVQTRFKGPAARVANKVLDRMELVWREAIRDGSIKDDIASLEAEAWGKKANDIFKKFSGHLRPEESKGNPPRIPLGGDAAPPHDRGSEADAQADEERARLGRGGEDIRRSARGSAGARRASAGAPRAGLGRRGAAGPVSGGQPNPTAAPGVAPRLKLPEPSGLSQPRQNIRPAEFIRALKSFFNPESLGPEALATAGTIRHQHAEAYHRLAISTHALDDFKKSVEKLSREEQVQLWDDAEHGRSIGDATLDEGNRLLRRATDQRTQQLIALDRLKAEKVIENYIGRFWSQTASRSGRDFLRAIMGRRPFEGPKSFLKQRELDWFVDGLKREDLVPATYNYVESQLAKIAEMERVIAAEHTLRQEKVLGRAKPLMLGVEPPVDQRGEKWVKIDRTGEDPAFNIYLPPDVQHWEAVDTLVYGKLQKLIDDLNVQHIRSPKIGGTRLGYAQGDKYIATKFGGAEGVVMHELGHILDSRYGLGDRIDQAIGAAPKRTATKGKKAGQQVPDYKNEGKEARGRRQTLREELRQLANLRRETLAGVPTTKDLGKTDRAYLHSRDEKMANMVEAYIGARDRFRQVAPGIFKIFDDVVGQHPELNVLRDIQPSLSREEHGATTRVSGIITGGHWYAPKDAAAVWGNHLSKGLAGNPIYDAAIAPIHAGTQMLLGFSGFHGTVIATEAAFSDLALAIDNLANKGGHAARAPKQIGRALASPVAGVTFGRKVMQEYRIPGTHPELKRVLDAMIAGGFRGKATSELWAGDRKERLKRAFRETLHAESKGRRLWGASKLPFDAIWAGVEFASGPLMSKYVPLMKTAATYNAVAQALGKLPPNTPIDVLHRVMGDVVKEMDYRFGQVDYDNHFLNRVAKDLAQLVFLAPGWTFGTLALAGRGLSDAAKLPVRAAKLAAGGDGAQDGEEPPPELIGRSAAYWIGAVLGTMLINGTLTYFNTGERPQGKDYWAFRDGSKDQAGNWNRHTIPGYLMHDIYGWARHPVHTFKNKFAPTLAFFLRLAENKDYFGDMVYDPDASLPTKAKQAGKALVKQHTPLSLQNYFEGKKRGEIGPTEVARNVFGVTPARRELVRTPAQNKLAEYLGRHASASRTPEEAEKGDVHRQVVDAVRKGEMLPRSVMDLLTPENGQQPKLSRETLFQWIGEAKQPTPVTQFKKLSFKEAQKVWELANEDEKAQWVNAYRTKAVNARR